MPKVKVTVLYPTAFELNGVDTEGMDEVSVEAELAKILIDAGWAEPVKASKAVKTETGAVKLEADGA